MKVYFYTCPLEAGYMARYFRVEFHCENGCWTNAHFEDDPCGEGYYQVNPVSLPIFDEKIGDVLLQSIDDDKDWFRLGYKEQLDCYTEPDNMKSIIIRRNGRAFFMPKEKDV